MMIKGARCTGCTAAPRNSAHYAVDDLRYAARCRGRRAVAEGHGRCGALVGCAHGARLTLLHTVVWGPHHHAPIRSLRSFSFLMPAKIILVPLMYCTRGRPRACATWGWAHALETLEVRAPLPLHTQRGRPAPRTPTPGPARGARAHPPWRGPEGSRTGSPRTTRCRTPCWRRSRSSRPRCPRCGQTGRSGWGPACGRPPSRPRGTGRTWS